ncbi:MAG: shikimate dehydrogenase [Planctomycetes bacterium SCN 63-9]|nr:MAG: shikimate dehydrogenase [Planctomycetes bacterium SCN 63-9]
MICATIGRGRHSSLLEEWKAAAEAGADLVELRLDCLRRDVDLKRILKVRHTPIVCTIRRTADGGLWRGQEEKRQQLLREAIVLGVDYVDIEVDIAPEIRRYGKTKRIVSYHNMQAMPEDLDDVVYRCEELDPDIIKIAVQTKTLAEASQVLRYATTAKFPAITIAMGEIGAFTRILGAKYGAPFTYAGFNPERQFAPGMFSFRRLQRDFHYNRINSQTEVYAVIGDPIEQSLSPAVHNAAFRHLGLNKVLVPFRVPDGSLPSFFEDLAWLGIKGCSVTIPHKEAILPLLHQKEGAVDRTKACNTVLIDANTGERTGLNTDYRAAMDSLEMAMGGRSADDGPSPLFEKQVLILGAGGVARSIAFGLERRGAVVTITNRHDERATALAEEVSCRTVTWAGRASLLTDVVVNCTPVGMHPDVDDTPLPPAAFSRAGMMVFDTIYHPENTMLIKLARERGASVVTGVEMFVLQAAHQFNLYTGMTAPLELMRNVVKRKLGPLRDE